MQKHPLKFVEQHLNKPVKSQKNGLVNVELCHNTRMFADQKSPKTQHQKKSLEVWGCFSEYDTGMVHIIEERMNGNDYT